MPDRSKIMEPEEGVIFFYKQKDGTYYTVEVTRVDNVPELGENVVSYYWLFIQKYLEKYLDGKSKGRTLSSSTSLETWQSRIVSEAQTIKILQRPDLLWEL